MYSLCGAIRSGTTPVFIGGVGLFFSIALHATLSYDIFIAWDSKFEAASLVVSSHECVLNFFFSMKIGLW